MRKIDICCVKPFSFCAGDADITLRIANTSQFSAQTMANTTVETITRVSYLAMDELTHSPAMSVNGLRCVRSSAAKMLGPDSGR